MADRYWVGGTAAWDGTAGTKWALTSGGAGGQAVPTSADDVFFSNLSTGTCTISAGNIGAKSINCTGFTGTLAGSSAITVSGSVTLVAGMTFTYAGLITLIATGTLTSAGKTLSSIAVNGSGITVTLGDALTSTSQVTLTAGTLTTANFNVTAFSFSSTNSNTRALNMGSSTFTLSSTSIPWNIQTTTGLTLNAGTSTINLTGNGSRTFYGGGFTYYNLNDGGGTSLGIVGNNTFNDFTATGLIGLNILECFGTNTFTNFNYSPAAPASAELRGGTFSKSSGTVSVSRLLILNSTATGGATWNASASRDLGGNTGWNITAPATARYWVGGTDAWDGTAGAKWATTSGGAGGASAPGAVEEVFFTNLSAGTCTISSGNSGAFSINCAGFLGTLAGTTAISLYGDVILPAGMTYTYTGTITFRSSATLTTGGKTLGSVTASQGTLTLGSACTLGTTSTFILAQGTLALSNFTLSTGIFYSQGNLTRQIQFGTGNIALTSTTVATTVLSMADATNFTFTGTGGFTRNQAATATVVFGTTSGTTSNAPNLTVNAGSSVLTITSGSYFKNVIFTGSTSAVTASNLNMAGNLTLASGGTYTSVFATFRGSATITSAGRTLGTATINGSGITVTLADVASISNFTLTSGTIDLAGFTLNIGIFTSSNTNTRSIAFGTADIVLAASVSGTVLAMATATNFTWTGTGGFTRSMLSASTVTVQFGSTAGGTVSNAPNLSINAGGQNLTITSGSYFKNVIFTGSTSAVTASGLNIAGNLTLATGGTYTAVVPTFLASATVTSNGKTLGNTTINASGITVTLADAMTLTASSTFLLGQGTLNLAGFNLSTGIFSSNGVSTRAISFGSGNIALTSTTAGTTILSMAAVLGFSWTGTGGFTRNMAATAVVNFGTSNGGTVSRAPNLTVNAGSATLTFSSDGGNWFKNLNFTGSTGTPISTNQLNIAGNLTLASGGTYTSLTTIIYRDSGTITSVGKTLANVNVNGSGITVTLADAMTLGTSNILTLTEGTFTAANFNVTAGSFSSSNSNTRTLNMGSGTWTISGSGATAWSTATTTGLTVAPSTSTVSMTSASAKTFAGGGLTYYNLDQGGAGTLTISGSNTFNDITDTVQPSTVTFTAGTTQTVSNFSLAGTAGNLVTINSTTPGSQFTLSKSSGTVNAQYLAIQDSNATGGAIWNALFSTNLGNNTGWIFPGGNMFLMFI